MPQTLRQFASSTILRTALGCKQNGKSNNERPGTNDFGIGGIAETALTLGWA